MKAFIIMLLTLLHACKPAASENPSAQTKKNNTQTNTTGGGSSADFLGSCHYQGYIGGTTCEDIFNDGLAGRTAQFEKNTCETSMNGTWQTTKCDTTARVGCSCIIKDKVYNVMWMNSGTTATACSQVSLAWKCALLGT